MQTSQLWIAKLPEPGAPAEAYASMEWAKIVENFEASYEYVTNDGPLFLLITSLDAPKKRIVQVDITQPGASWSGQHCNPPLCCFGWSCSRI